MKLSFSQWEQSWCRYVTLIYQSTCILRYADIRILIFYVVTCCVWLCVVYLCSFLFLSKCRLVVFIILHGYYDIGIVNFWKDSMEQCNYVMMTEVGYGLCNCPLRTSVFHPLLLTPLCPLLLSHRFSLSLPSTSLILFPHPLPLSVYTNALYVMVTVYRHTMW